MNKNTTRANPRPPLEILERRPGGPTAAIDERSMCAFLDSLTPEQRAQAVKRNPTIRALMERLGAKPGNATVRQRSKRDLSTVQARFQALQLRGKRHR
jgi:hypothetical protein